MKNLSQENDMKSYMLATRDPDFKNKDNFITFNYNKLNWQYVCYIDFNMIYIYYYQFYFNVGNRPYTPNNKRNLPVTVFMSSSCKVLFHRFMVIIFGPFLSCVLPLFMCYLSLFADCVLTIRTFVCVAYSVYFHILFHSPEEIYF